MSKPFNPRDFWLPKQQELPEKCVSCPFREGNDEEFGAVCERLRDSEDNPFRGMPLTKEDAVANARESIREQTARLGDFSCHCTVYNADMTQKPRSEWRQCPGASEHYRAEGARLMAAKGDADG